MKKIISVLLCIAVSTVLFSCTKAEKELDYIYQTDSTTIKADDGTVVYTADYTFPYFTGGDNRQAQKLNDFFQKKRTALSKPDFDYKAEYKQYIKDGKDYFMHADYSAVCTVTFLGKNTVSFEESICDYPACAIKEYDRIDAFCLNINNSSPTELQTLENDGKAFDETLLSYVTNELKRRESENELSDIEYDEMKKLLSSEFKWCLEDDSFNVYFNAGDIAPAVHQYIKISIPFDRFGSSFMKEAI